MLSNSKLLRRISCISILILYTIHSNAQIAKDTTKAIATPYTLAEAFKEKKDTTKKDISAFTATKQVFRIYVPIPSIEYEGRIAPTTTLRAMGFVGFHYETVNGVTTANEVFPILGAGINQYLNVHRRIKKDKRVDKFSANYLFASAAAQMSSDPIGVVAAGYGINRNIGRSGFFGISLGLKLLIAGPLSRVGPAFGIGLGFSFPKADAKYSTKVISTPKQ